MLSTSFPHSIPFGDTPWWSTTWSDGVNNYEDYYNDPTDMGYLYWVSFGIFTLSGKITAFLGPILASVLTFLISQRVGFGFSIVLLSLGLFLMIGVSYNNVKSKA